MTMLDENKIDVILGPADAHMDSVAAITGYSYIVTD
jgi:hypothetical protein